MTIKKGNQKEKEPLASTIRYSAVNALSRGCTVGAAREQIQQRTAQQNGTEGQG